LEEVAVRADRKVLMEVDYSSSLIFGNPQGILSQQLRPRPIHLLNIIITLINWIILYIIIPFILSKTEDNPVHREE
jgi:hypothetical protein